MHIDTRNFTTRLSEWIKGKTVTMPNDVVGVKELERSFVAGDTSRCTATPENMLQFLIKLAIRPNI